jgi:hypothetical protein
MQCTDSVVVSWRKKKNWTGTLIRDENYLRSIRIHNPPDVSSLPLLGCPVLVICRSSRLLLNLSPILLLRRESVLGTPYLPLTRETCCRRIPDGRLSNCLYVSIMVVESYFRGLLDRSTALYFYNRLSLLRFPNLPPLP